MIQAIGLTSTSRHGGPPRVDDLTFEARAGEVTALYGPPAAGKTTALLLMLQACPGRGVALFRGRPMNRIPHPAREVGVILGEVPGHPARTARGHLRMLAAAGGVPAARAGEVLELVGLSGLSDHRLGEFSRGMDRRLAVAAALLGDPHTLVLDEPSTGLSRREAAWLHGLVRGYAVQGGTVLLTTADAREARDIADRVVTLEAGTLRADQSAEEFSRARTRPRVTVHTPQADRLAAALRRELHGAAPADGGVAPPMVAVAGEGQLAVYGSSPAVVGEIAYRHQVPMHRLAEESPEGAAPRSEPLHRADGRRTAAATVEPRSAVSGPDGRGRKFATWGAAIRAGGTSRGRERPLARGASGRAGRPLSMPGPSWPLRYEVRRLTGLRSNWLIMAGGVSAGLCAAAGLALFGAAAPERVPHGWADPLPVPPAALAAGVLGALAFGQEFRYPALAAGTGPAARKLGLLGAKLLMSAVVALALCAATAGLAAVLLPWLVGPQALVEAPQHGGALAAALWGAAGALPAAAAAVGCAWAGLLAAGVLRSTAGGLAAVAAVPWLTVPALQAVASSPAGPVIRELPERLTSFTGVTLPPGAGEGLAQFGRLGGLEPAVTWSLLLALLALLGSYLLMALRAAHIR